MSNAFSPAYREHARASIAAHREETALELYDQLHAAEEARQRAEWEGQFDEPFKPDGAEIHKVVERQLAATKQNR